MVLVMQAGRWKEKDAAMRAKCINDAELILRGLIR